MRKLERFYPPGYPLRTELLGTGCIFGIALIFNLRFLLRLGNMLQTLYFYQGGERFLKPDAVAQSFSQLTRGCWVVFLVPLSFLAMQTVGHYLFYWQQTKSIYVMRRISRRGVTFLSCVVGPVLLTITVLLVAALLYGLYLGLYWLIVPAECMPRFM